MNPRYSPRTQIGLPMSPEVVECETSPDELSPTSAGYETQAKLGIQSGKQSNRVQHEGHVKEEMVQRGVLAHLPPAGYDPTLQTTVRYKKQTCPRCHHRFRPTGGYGSSRGVPDVLTRHPDWEPHGLWLGLELKGKTTRLSPEQKSLEKGGHIVIARSWEAALGEAEKVTRILREHGLLRK